MPRPPKKQTGRGSRAKQGARGGGRPQSQRDSRGGARRGTGTGGGSARGSAGRAPRDESRKPKDKGLGGEQVEGRQAVRELLLAGKRKVREVWVASDLDDSNSKREARHHRASSLLQHRCRKLSLTN